MSPDIADDRRAAPFAVIPCHESDTNGVADHEHKRASARNVAAPIFRSIPLAGPLSGAGGFSRLGADHL